VVGSRRTSLIVDPPDGRIPALSPEGQRRSAERRAAARTHGPADSYENRSLQERCITRGLPEVTLPGPYNNNLQIVQTPAYVMLQTEMIHDARIVPIGDAGPIRLNGPRWLGEPRGHWEGKTLVVDSLHFNPISDVRDSDNQLHLTERFTRADRETLLYEFTIDNPTAFVAPWSAVLPMTRSDDRIFEYACHEANYALMDILRGARAVERR